MSRVLVVDLFAAAGHSVGIEVALGRPVDVARFAALVRWTDGNACWEWLGYRQKRSSGALSYGLFCFGGIRILAHRLAYMLVHGWLDPGLVVRHRCDNVGCVRPDHLVAGSQAENLADMRERGRAHFNRFPTGPAHPKAKVDAERVRQIRALCAEGLSLAKIGARVGLHAATVHDIVTGKTWAHVAPHAEAATA